MPHKSWRLSLVEPPPGGWKEQTYYIVEVTAHPANPPWSAIFYSGFVTDGEPRGYAQVWSGSIEAPVNYHDLHTIKYRSEIGQLPNLLAERIAKDVPQQS